MNPKENLLLAMGHREPAWLPCPLIDGSLKIVFHGLKEYPSGGRGYDDWGVCWQRGEETFGAGLPVDHPLKSPGEVEKFPLPEPAAEPLLAGTRQELDRLDRGRALILADNGWGIFERAWLLVGMENLLSWMYMEPEAVRALLRRITDVKLKISLLLLDGLSIDGIRYGDDWGGEGALMMGPALWRKFIKPEQERLYRACKEREKLVFQHTDGHIEEIIPDLIEMGLDILNPLQPECNDLNRIKREYGRRLTFHGAVSSRLLDQGSPREVRGEVKKRIGQLSGGGGYIIAPAHGLDYPPENLKAFQEGVIRHGRLPAEWLEQQAAGRQQGMRGDVEV